MNFPRINSKRGKERGYVLLTHWSGLPWLPWTVLQCRLPRLVNEDRLDLESWGWDM